MQNYAKQKKRFIFPILSFVILSIITTSSINTYLNISFFEQQTKKEMENSQKNFFEHYNHDIEKQVEMINDSILFHRTRMEQELKKELKNRIDTARSICESIYSNFKEKLSDHEMRKLIASQLGSIHFDNENRGYYFAYQNSNKILYAHVNKEIVGKSIENIVDAKGINVAMAHDKALKGNKEIGFLTRYYYKPDNSDIGYPKLSAVTLFEPLDLVIGSGEYLDVIEKKLQEIVIERFKNFNVSRNIAIFILELHNINGGKGFATFLVNSENKALIGKKVDDDYKDITGKQFRKQYLKDLRQKGESFIPSLYIQLNNKEEKLSSIYFYLQEDWNWIIASSFYLDDLNKEIQNLKNSLEVYTDKAIKDALLFVSVLSSIMILIAILITLIIDKTIQKYLKEILKGKVELEMAQEVAQMGSWSLDHKTGELSVSNETFNIFEVESDKNQEKLDIEIFRKRVVLDDIASFDEAYYSSIRNKELATLQFRLNMDDGRIKIIDAKGETIFDKNGTPLVTNGTVQDITIEHQKDQELRRKEKLLIEKEKLASMGEMIGNIAHQWRQPLSIIATSTAGMLYKQEIDKLSDEDLKKSCERINKNVQYLSETIDDFRNFIKGDRQVQRLNLYNNINSFLHLVDGIIKSNEIEIILDTDRSINIIGYPNELIQCYLNIFNNAKDAMNINNIKNKVFVIKVAIVDNQIQILLRDNAGGVPLEIKSKVFDPYFTTKEQAQGTGLGLNMTYRLISEGMNGKITVENVEFEYNNKNYKGAEFRITLPLIQ